MHQQPLQKRCCRPRTCSPRPPAPPRPRYSSGNSESLYSSNARRAASWKARSRASGTSDSTRRRSSRTSLLVSCPRAPAREPHPCRMCRAARGVSGVRHASSQVASSCSTRPPSAAEALATGPSRSSAGPSPAGPRPCGAARGVATTRSRFTPPSCAATAASAPACSCRPVASGALAGWTQRTPDLWQLSVAAGPGVGQPLALAAPGNEVGAEGLGAPHLSLQLPARAGPHSHSAADHPPSETAGPGRTGCRKHR